MSLFVDLLGITIASTVTYIAQHDTDTDLNNEALLLNNELSLFNCFFVLARHCTHIGQTHLSSMCAEFNVSLSVTKKETFSWWTKKNLPSRESPVASSRVEL
jgi:hypothetical protein